MKKTEEKLWKQSIETVQLREAKFERKMKENYKTNRKQSKWSWEGKDVVEDSGDQEKELTRMWIWLTLLSE